MSEPDETLSRMAHESNLVAFEDANGDSKAKDVERVPPAITRSVKQMRPETCEPSFFKQIRSISIVAASFSIKKISVAVSKSIEVLLDRPGDNTLH